MSTTLPAVTESPQLHIAMSCPSPIEVQVVVVGEIDLATQAVLRDSLLRALHDHSPAVVDVDLAGVTFMDCTGISALLVAHTTALRSGCQLRVSHPQPIVGRVLAVTGVLGVLTAPIESRQPLRPESGYRSGTESSRVSCTLHFLCAAGVAVLLIV
jgi:anti-anti-sigma factor